MRHTRPARNLAAAARRGLVSVSALAALALAAAPAASAQTPDFTITKVEVNQAIQTGSTQLVAGRTTFVRAAVRVTNGVGIPLVDGLLRISVDGVEIAPSPVFSDNGPFPAKTPIDFTIEDGSLNFIFLAPEAPNVVLTVEANPAGPNHLDEANPANNTFTTPPLNFRFLRAPELAYVPIDYRPTGGSIPNLPNAAQIEPGMGDNFVQGIYPAPDWYYHRTDVPSKLWTSTLAGTGSTLLNALQIDINLTVPKPDFLYGFVPGGLPYNGQSFINGNVSMGNTELIRYQRTIAHELGHNTGLQHNSLSTNLIGVDVEHHLHLTQNLPQIKASSLKDIMFAGLLTQEAWVASASYNFFYNHPVFDPVTLAATAGDNGPKLMIAGLWNRTTGAIELTDVLTIPAGHATAPASPRDANLVVRTYAGGALLTELPLLARSSADDCPACRAEASTDAAATDGVEPAAAATADASNVSDADATVDAVVDAVALAPQSPAGSGTDSEQATDPMVPFTALLPLPAEGAAAIDRLVVAPLGVTHAVPFERQRSASAPQAAFTSPVNGAVGGGKLVVTWNASDADGDALRYHLRYSPDGKRFMPLATGLDIAHADVDLAVLPALSAGKGFFELFTSDGLITTVVRTQPLTGSSALLGAGNAPWVEILSPDNGFTFRQGGTVVLHSSGWDLEDHALSGESIQWLSDVDGPIGFGRLTSVTTLSAGQHVLTVRATDSNGQATTDTATITILPRDLPLTGDEVCQQDIGFGGPGALVLALCGGDLSSGTNAALALSGAPASAPGLLFAGMSNAPTPFKGGMLVPVPWSLNLAFVTDGSGEVDIAGIPGGGGPLTIYAQCAVLDGSQAQGFAISNAVQVELLP